jgi:hypothetical protein
MTCQAIQQYFLDTNMWLHRMIKVSYLCLSPTGELMRSREEWWQLTDEVKSHPGM